MPRSAGIQYEQQSGQFSFQSPRVVNPFVKPFLCERHPGLQPQTSTSSSVDYGGVICTCECTSVLEPPPCQRYQFGGPIPQMECPSGAPYFTGTAKGWSFSPSETTRIVAGLVMLVFVKL